MTTTPDDVKAALLPCPFCGGEAVETERFAGREANGQDYVVACGGCGAETNRFYGYKSDVHEAEKAAVIAWNTRATLSAALSRPVDVTGLEGALSQHAAAIEAYLLVDCESHGAAAFRKIAEAARAHLASLSAKDGWQPIGYVMGCYLDERKSEYERNGIVMYPQKRGMATTPVYINQNTFTEDMARVPTPPAEDSK